MKWKRKRNQVKLTVSIYETELGNGLNIQVDAQQGYQGLVCEWVVYESGFSPMAHGLCYGLKQAKQLAEQAARKA